MKKGVFFDSQCIDQVFVHERPIIIFALLLLFYETKFALERLQENPAVARKPRDAAAVLFSLKFADDIHYKFNSSQASKARLQSSKHTGTKQNLTQNGDSRSFKVTCFGVSGKLGDKALSNTV